jgi:hypothetical protein
MSSDLESLVSQWAQISHGVSPVVKQLHRLSVHLKHLRHW